MAKLMARVQGSGNNTGGQFDLFMRTKDNITRKLVPSNSRLFLRYIKIIESKNPEAEMILFPSVNRIQDYRISVIANLNYGYICMGLVLGKLSDHLNYEIDNISERISLELGKININYDDAVEKVIENNTCYWIFKESIIENNYNYRKRVPTIQDLFSELFFKYLDVTKSFFYNKNTVFKNKFDDFKGYLKYYEDDYLKTKAKIMIGELEEELIKFLLIDLNREKQVWDVNP